MERNIWRASYGSFPPFTCPRCSTGKLRMKKDSKQVFEPHHSKSEHGEPGWGEWDITARFICFLVCSNSFCGEVVTATGYESYREEEYGGEDGPETVTHESLQPKMLWPAPYVIKVSAKLSADCKRLLISSFEQLWMDQATCANRLRSFVEHLLDDLGVKRVVTRANGSKYEKTLGTLIKEFDLLRPGHKPALEALRNVGNLGSHGTKLKFDTILSAYELLEDALEDLVEGKRARLDALAQKLSDKNGLL
jgi:uncharacterized protein YjiS (DUF1127 family)